MGNLSQVLSPFAPSFLPFVSIARPRPALVHLICRIGPLQSRGKKESIFSIGALKVHGAKE